jgi:lipid A ethanolaminephosphotransferase
MPFEVIGQDASIGAPLAQARKPTLVFLVVGETARAQNFSLDGYGRDTNPELAQRQVLSFRQVQSCGTETAVSLPCMFSPYARKDYSLAKALHTSNLLDVLKRAGVTVLWRDNNSGSKGMADRVAYEDVSASDDPSACAKDREHCYDSVLLYHLPQWLAQQQAKPGAELLVVLHMYGSHGPAYYKRYPSAFARFQPECKTNELSRCTREAITNSYDNTILYTDHVLAQMIDFLKQQGSYNTALLYLSDHGESLGENGIYLHGMPWHLAPEQQRHIPFIWWMSQGYAGVTGLSASCLEQRIDEPLSQDYLFSSLLGIFAVRSQVYDAALDFLAPCRGAH